MPHQQHALARLLWRENQKPCGGILADDTEVWKRWVDNNNAADDERLATVTKTLMLRRSKQELQAKGTLASLPDKTIEVIDVELDPEERLVYDKAMVYSRTLFARFLAQRAEKAHMYELGSGKFDKPSGTVTHKDTQFNTAQILVVLLRLRQVCCHPSVIYAMLDEEETEQVGAVVGADVDLMSQLNGIKIKDEDEQMEGEVGVDERVAENLRTAENPVFYAKRQSSKMRAVLEKVREILSVGEKLIVVSQWTSVFNILEDELMSVHPCHQPKCHHRVFRSLATAARPPLAADEASEKSSNLGNLRLFHLRPVELGNRPNFFRQPRDLFLDRDYTV